MKTEKSVCSTSRLNPAKHSLNEDTGTAELDLRELMGRRGLAKPTGVVTRRRRKIVGTGPRAIVPGRHVRFLLILVAFLLVVLACIVEKGDLRAAFKTVEIEISFDVKEKREPTQPKRREDDQKSMTSEPKE